MGDFKAIIIGGGPVGMIMAHTLDRAGIDYVLCEQRPKIETLTGAGFVMWVHGTRILHQLGLLEAIEPRSSYIATDCFTGPGGKVIRIRYLASQERFGYNSIALDRSLFLETLYKHLPNSDKTVKLGKRLIDIDVQQDGVVAKFEDGTSETGSVVIGADGIWSVARDAITKMSPRDMGLEEKNPFAANYACHFGRGYEIKGLPENTMIYKVGNGWALQLGVSDGQTIWILEKPIPRSQERTKYTSEDEKRFLKDVLDEKFYNDFTIRDAWEKRIATGLTNLDSGVLETPWYGDRIVLLGDAVHKPEPNIGAGIVLGTEGAVVLTNSLHALLKDDPNPSTEALTKIFASYQERQEPRAKFVVNAGHGMLDHHTYKTWKNWFMFTFVSPWLIPWLNDYVIGPWIAAGPRLNFMPFPEERSGYMPWKDNVEDIAGKTSRSWYESLVGPLRYLFGYKDKPE